MEETGLEHSIPFVTCQHPLVSPCATIIFQICKFESPETDVFLTPSSRPKLKYMCSQKNSQQAPLAYSWPIVSNAWGVLLILVGIVLGQHHINLGSNSIGSMSTGSRFQSGLLEENELVCMEAV